MISPLFTTRLPVTDCPKTLPFKAEGPRRARAAEVEGQAVVAFEIGGRFRSATTREIGRGGADDAPALPKLAGDQAAIRQIAHANGDIGLLRNQIDDSVCEAQIDDQVGIAVDEGGHGRRDEHRAERDGGVDPQPSPHRAARRFLIGIVQILQDLERGMKIGLAFIRQGQRTGRAQQKASAADMGFFPREQAGPNRYFV
jgi:hypothetical protein